VKEISLRKEMKVTPVLFKISFGRPPRSFFALVYVAKYTKQNQEINKLRRARLVHD
jgi:hypothetical protein